MPSLEEVVSKENPEQLQAVQGEDGHDKHLERYQIRRKWEQRYG